MKTIQLGENFYVPGEGVFNIQEWVDGLHLWTALGLDGKPITKEEHETRTTKQK